MGLRPNTAQTLMIKRQTAAGAPATGAVLADFGIQAYVDDTAYNAAAISATITEGATSADSAWRFYALDFVVPNALGSFRLDCPTASGTDIVSPDVFMGEIETEDLDTIAALLQTSQGVPAVLSAADSDLGEYVDGDTFLSGTLTVPLGKLTPLGVSVLTTLTAQASAKLTAADSPITLTVTVLDATARTFTLGWAAGTLTSLGTSESPRAWYIDVQFIDGSTPKKIATTNRYTITQVWQREARTS